METRVVNFLEIFRGKFSEISDLTTLMGTKLSSLTEQLAVRVYFICVTITSDLLLVYTSR